MIETCKKYDVCPFCGGEFVFDGEKFYCKKCKTELYEEVCEYCKKEYIYSSVNYPILKKKRIDIHNYAVESLWKYYNDKDSQLNYRNITDIDVDGKPMCPYCSNINSTQK